MGNKYTFEEGWKRQRLEKQFITLPFISTSSLLNLEEPRVRARRLFGDLILRSVEFFTVENAILLASGNYNYNGFGAPTSSIKVKCTIALKFLL